MTTAAVSSKPERVLIAGFSTRAAAESAGRAGFDVTALDAFADLDRHPRVRAFSLPRDFGIAFSPMAVARLARSIPADAVTYLSSLDNHPRSVAALGAGRALWGNAPPVLRRVRDPWLLASALNHRGFATPDTPARALADRESRTGRWLVKPVKSGGGHRVREWRAGRAVPRGSYLQERIDGTPGSAVFVAAGGRAVLLGVSRQLVGDMAFGAGGYRYCGNILTLGNENEIIVEPSQASALAVAIAEAFGVVGVNGVDFIVRRRVPYVIEVNPRWSASVELIERAHGLSVFGAHAAACSAGTLPTGHHATAAGAAAVGKAVVFARRDVLVGETGAWLTDETVRDVPRAGERIRAGQPVCTVFAEGRSAADCHAGLVARAERVYAQIAEWNRRIA